MKLRKFSTVRFGLNIYSKYGLSAENYNGKFLTYYNRFQYIHFDLMKERVC